MIEQALTRLRALAAMIGSAGVVGIGLSVFGIALYVSSVLPERAELERLEAKASRGTRLASGYERISNNPAASASQLERFQQRFPSLNDAPAFVLKLHQIASSNGIALGSGEYRLVRDPAWNIARYQVTLPLKASYPQVRLFTAQLLDEIPALSLDEIAIKRESIAARDTETRVRLTAYFVDQP